MAAPGLERHRLALLAAKEDVSNPRAGTNWAVFAYEKHHDLKLLDSGAGGPDELAGKFSATSIMYGLCRIPDPSTGAHRIVLISWVGEKVPESQRETCAGHLPAIRAFFREASVVLSARRAEEVTQEGLSRALAQLAPAAALTRRVPPPDAQELVGTNYRKTNPALEIRRTKRDSFWAQAEREEEQRKEEERRRALEERKRWERERMEEERREAAERELRFREKERMIEEQRKEQARLEAEERRKEKARWEQQQREHEEAMRDRSRRSESIEKAAEAAVLVSQRSQNPRDFFRQRERSGSTSGAPLPPSSPGTRPGAWRPFLRYQRSLTESAFIFRRPDPPPSPEPLQPGMFRAAPPPSPRRPQPPLPTSPTRRWTPPSATLGSPPSPVGTGTPQCATTRTPTSPTGRGTPPCATLGSPPSPVGTGTPQCATTGTPTSPTGRGTPPSATLGSPPSPVGTGTPQCATTGTPTSLMGRGTPPSATSGSPPSPARAGPPHATSPIGTRPLPCATLGSPPSPVGAGVSMLASSIGTAPSPFCATWAPPSLVGSGAGSPPDVPGTGPLPSMSPPRMGCPPGPPGSGSPDSTSGAEPLPLHSSPRMGHPGSPPWHPSLGTEEAVSLPPPSPSGTPQDEDGTPLDTYPLPSPPAWVSPGLPVGPGEGVLSSREGSPLPGLVPAPMPPASTPQCSPSPPNLPQDLALPHVAAQGPQPGPVGQEPARADLGHNGIGGHKQGGWLAPWTRTTPQGRGDEPATAPSCHSPCTKPSQASPCCWPVTPLTRSCPRGTSPTAEDEDLSPHTV
ncbi:uncharacterized protein LOC142056835 [Phalacrocorax aristotelis]|uniref:uncharacterized protein LOC142056835 n=1 Tax=Phalacrocorax aristotelis TaxID=126867 RepID=UPI003F4C0257